MNPSTSANDWKNIWNQTGDMGISNNHNYFMIADGWDTSSGNWSIIDDSVVGSKSGAYLAANFNAWSETELPFVYTSYKEAQAKIDLSPGTYTFKLFKDGAWFGNPRTINDTTSGNGWSMCKNDKDNCTINATGGTYTFTLNTETLKVNVDFVAGEVVGPTVVPTEKPTEEATVTPTSETDVLPSGYYLVGTLSGKDCWGIANLSKDRLFKENTANSGEYMLEYTFAEGDEIKVVHYDGTDFTSWYNSDGKNYSIGSSKAGLCDVYFRPEGNSAWSYTYFTVLPKTVDPTEAPTAIPTEEPTPEPTEPPTEKPTTPPTEAPTSEPTEAPNKPEAGYYLVGTLNGEDCWSIASLNSDRLFKANPYNSGEYMLEYTFVEGDSIKVIHYDGTDFTAWYNNGGENYNIGAKKVGLCDVYFRPEGNSSWSYNYFTVIPREAIPTEAPTQAPTEPPTEEPTEGTSETPSEEESSEATEEPTEAPTQVELSKVSNIKTEATSATVKFTWDALSGGTAYWVYVYNENTESWICLSSTRNTTMAVYKLTADTDYKFKITACIDNKKYLKIEDADVISVHTADAIATTSITGTASATTARITWEPIEGAQKYWLYRSNYADGPYYCYTSTTDSTYLVNKLRPENEYYFKVAALTYQNGFECYSNYKDSPVCGIKTGSASIIGTVLTSNTATTATITWPEYENSDMYWVKYSTTSADTNDASHWSTLEKLTDRKYTIKNLKPDTVYYLNIGARYYDPYTGKEEFIDYIPVQVRTAHSDENFITFTEESETSVTLTWSEDIPDIVKTWIYVYDFEGNRVEMASTETNTYTFKKLVGYKDYFYELRIQDTKGRYLTITPTGGFAYE